MLFLLTLLQVLTADPDTKAVEKLALDAQKAWDVPGLAIVVVRGDDTVFIKGFGARAIGKQEPITADTLFPLASCSKAFTTTLLAMLADDGKIGWDDRVKKHLPGFRLSDPHADALLTIRDLLCHRSGIGGHDLLWYRAPWGIDEIVKRTQALPLDYPFRGGYRYSTLPFLVAGRAIEKRTGEKWERLVQNRICDPLGMTSTRFTSTSIPRGADRATGHKVGKGGKVEPMAEYEVGEPNPAGSVYATPTDIAAWLKFHLARGVGPDGKRLVSLKNLVETHTAQNLIPMRGATKELNPDTVQLAYAMAWLVYDYRGKKIISHGGMIDGYRVQLTFLPGEGIGFAVLCNLHDTRMTLAVTHSLVDLYCGLEAKDWNSYYRKIVDNEAAERKRALAARDKARDPNAKPTLPIAAFAGSYEHPAYGEARIIEKHAWLTLVYGSFNCPLAHFERDTFRVNDGFFEEQLVQFVVTAGKVAAVKFQEQEFKRK